MEKLKFETPDMVAGNIEKIGALFPAAITEMRGEDGQIKKGINFEVLKQLLSRDVVDGDECYEFTWVGKKAAMAEAARPITKTLRPVKEDSRDWDTTQNLYIEGDNLEVLKILQESYLGKVKMIYIDPPYNTGTDKFVYRDKFEQTEDEYATEAGVYDDAGKMLYQINKDTNPRFHSRWCSEMMASLMLCRNLLAADGVLLISIDDRESHNMRKICDEVLGANSFVAQLVWEKKKKGSFLSNQITNIKEYVLVYCKDASQFIGLIGEINSDTETYPCVNASNKREVRIVPPGIKSQYKEKNFCLPKGSEISDTTMNLVLHSDLVIENGILTKELAIEGNWRYSQEAMSEYARKKELYITRDLYLRRIVKDKRLKTLKDLLPRVGDDPSGQYGDLVNRSNLFESGWGSNEDADEELRTLFGVQKLLEYPKPVKLLYKLIAAYRENNFTVLDFFSGSATTAHAVMKLNAEDNGHRRFIMVQLSELCDQKSIAFKAGYKNICEIGKERIRRAGDKIKEDNPLGTQDLDIGFRVFRVDSSNMKDVHYQPEELDQQSMFDLVSNIKNDRTDLDLLYACLLDWGVEIHLPHTSTDLDGCAVHNVDNGALMACFSPNVPRSVVEYMAKQQPLRAVFRDSAFASDDAKINVTEIFKNLSPDTKVKVI